MSRYGFPLRGCEDKPAGLVGSKARMLAWAEANGLATPGGWVIPSDAFWAALEDCGVAGKARYLQACMLDLEPAHVIGIAETLSRSLAGPRLKSFAEPLASAAYERLGAPRLACRSSAAMEDGADAAFPGIFSSRLDIASPEALANAIADAWRSVFSPTAIQYILRVTPAALDLSLALLIQRQIEAVVFGLWFGADPSAETSEPVIELSLSGPEALVGGLPPWMRLHRRFGRWQGQDADGELTHSLVRLEAAARTLEVELRAPADIEFALPKAGEEPIILQARPITRVDATARARRLAGFAVGTRDGGARTAAARDCEPLIAVIEGLDNDTYNLAFHYDGIVIERLVSRLGHFSILCRELGVPVVSGVADATRRLIGRYVAIDEAANSVEVLDRPPTVSSSRLSPRTAGIPRAVITSTELLVILLANASKCGGDPVDTALAMGRAYGRTLGARTIEIIATPLSSSDMTALNRIGRPLFGDTFSAAVLRASLPRTVMCQNDNRS